MNEIILELETVTPLFIAGADQRNIENEGLRAPSLRGLLRWWFRALAGVFTQNDITFLKKVENEIFGSTNSKSKISIRTSGENSPSQITKECRSWDEAIVWSDHVDYLFFSCLDKRRDRRRGIIKVISRPYYPEGSQFRISLSGSENELKAAIASLWALIHLGGVGFRARRGCGCLKVKDVRGDTFGLNFICKNPDELEEFLRNNIETALKIMRELCNVRYKPTSIPKYAVLSPNHSSLFIKKISGKDWVSALDEIGMWYIGQRRGRKFVGGFRMNLADYSLSHAIRDAHRNDYIASNKERRPYLGLPVTYATYRATLKGEKFDRRSSQLMFGVYEINGSFIPRILIFRSTFLPEFKGNFVVEKKVRDCKGERKIILNAALPDSSVCSEITKDCYENLKASNWQVVWGLIK